MFVNTGWFHELNATDLPEQIVKLNIILYKTS